MDQLALCNYALGKLGEATISSFNDTRPAAACLRTHYQPTLDNLIRKYRWNFARKSVVLAPDYTTIESISSGAGDVVQIESTAHGLATGDRVILKDTGVDGYYVITVVDADNFTCDDSEMDAGAVAGSYHHMPAHTYDFRISLPDDCAALRTLDGYESKSLPRNYVIEGKQIFTDQDQVAVVYTQRQTGGTDEGNFDDTFKEVFSTLLAANIAMGVTGAIARRNAMMQMYEADILDALMSNVFERRDPNINRKFGETSYEARTA